MHLAIEILEKELRYKQAVCENLDRADMGYYRQMVVLREKQEEMKKHRKEVNKEIKQLKKEIQLLKERCDE